MAYYFSHDSNARNDEKIIALRIRHGWEGYGLYWAIIEKMREADDYTCVKDYNIIAFDLRTDAAKIKSIIEDYGLFTFTEDGKRFYSESLLRRMDEKDKVAQVRKEAALKRWKPTDNAFAMQMQCKSNANAMQNETFALQRKEKKKNQKENKRSIVIDDDVNNARAEDFDFVKSEKNESEKESSGGAVAVADVAPAAVAVAPVQVQRGVYGAARCKPVADLVAECKASTAWVESVCMSTGLSQADVLTRLDGFPAHLTANGYDGDKSMDDFKRHFFNFIKKQQTNYANTKQATAERTSGLCPSDGRYYAKPNPDDIYAEHRRRYGLQ